MTLACRTEDWLFPTYREASIVYYLRGHPAFQKVHLIWMGLEEGLRLDKGIRCFPYATPIGTQFPHAVGAAYALRSNGREERDDRLLRRWRDQRGRFPRCDELRGRVEHSRTVFVISNNQYAISVPRKSQTKSETLAQKALAYGFNGIQVDGNDILSVYRAVKEAADNARSGKGPIALEFITYRMGPHTTSDDPKKYRDEKEVAYWRDRDPIKRFQIYLKAKGIWDEQFEKDGE